MEEEAMKVTALRIWSISLRIIEGRMNSVEKWISRSIRIGRDIYSRWSPSITTRFVNKCSEELRKQLMGSFDRQVMWVKRLNGDKMSFVEFLQIFWEKTVLTLKSTAFVSYAIYGMLLNLLLRNGAVADTQ